ncbi:MAG: hypothetical protein NVSMB55_09780 [Mycobacteriales bacterium]
MHSTTTLRTATAVLAVGLALAGCKSNKSASPATDAPARTSAAAPSPAATVVAPAAGATVAASGPAGAKTCTAGHTSAVIGGVSKCLAPGQLCSSKHIGDYPQYGFTCEQNGTRYTLKKKA